MSPPTDHPCSMNNHNFQQSPGVFQIGHGGTVQITGGQFVQHNQLQANHKCYEATDGFQHLQAHVATSAFDSQDHIDTPKCHSNTRKAILHVIMSWIITVNRVQWILWLNGAAGAGKSAICRSIVDLCIARNIPIARFFFFRTDPTQNNIKPLVATLAHQLLQSIPDLKPVIISRMESDSLIFTKSIRTQFKYLIFDPLCELIKCRRLSSLVLLCDGVNECDNKDDQIELINIVAEYLKSKSYPVIVLFASRVEDRISMAFRSKLLSDITYTLPLNDNYLPDGDIRLFLKDSFDEIKRAHPSARFLDKDWPTSLEVQEMVEKSSGQFIYASVVLKFCAMPSRHPKQQLEIIRGLRPRGALTPFAQLDALYHQIFSQVEDIALACLVLAFTMSTKRPTLKKSAAFLGLEVGDIYSALAPLQSVIGFGGYDTIYFLHRSLQDFLLDKERSQQYYLDLPAWRARFSIIAHKTMIEKGSQYDIHPMMFLGRNTEATPELQDHILAFDPGTIKEAWLPLAFVYLLGVSTMDFGDGPGGAVFQRKVDVFARYLYEIGAQEQLDDLQFCLVCFEHNTSDILEKIKWEAQSMEKDSSPNYKANNQLKAAADTDKAMRKFTCVWYGLAGLAPVQPDIQENERAILGPSEAHTRRRGSILCVHQDG